MKKITLLNILLTSMVFMAATCEKQTEEAVIGVLELNDKIEKGKSGILLDVRTPEEISKGVIDESITQLNFRDSDFRKKIEALDKKETYYVYCHSGGRSGKTVELMKELGFKKVYNVEGGITQWQEQGLKLVKID